MSLPGNGIFVVKGEISIILTAMRRGNRWSSHHQDDDQDPLIKAFQELKDLLNTLEDLRLIDPVDYLAPFLKVIRSEDTTGPITSLALSAVNKFLSYGLIDPTHSSVPLTVHNIADAVTHARFVGTDQSSDGVVLMKILQVLKTLTLSPEGAALTNESLCDIMLSCFRICFETRLNELLRRTAEYYLKDMIQLVFMRLPQFPEVFTGNFKLLKMRPGSMEQTRMRKRSRGSNKMKHKGNTEKAETDESNIIKPASVTHTADNIVDMQGSISQAIPQEQSASLESSASDVQSSLVVDENQSASDETQTLLTCDTMSSEDAPKKDDAVSIDQVESAELSVQPELKVVGIEGEAKELKELKDKEKEDYVNQRGITFTPQHPDDMVLIPYGLACVYELFRFLISLCNPHDKQNTDVMVHLGLTLLTTAFEVGADSIGKYSSLLALVKDELCRNLFSLLTSERLSVFAADLQVSFLMFESLRTHLKFQLEHYLTKLVDIIVSDSPKVTYEHKEIALDNILQLWRIPGFTTELYLNYDCDMYCSNLYEDLTKLLAKNAYPITQGVYHTHLLSLDALLTVVDAIAKQCEEKNNFKSPDVVAELSAEQDDTIVERGDHETAENLDIQSFIGKGNQSRLKVSENVPTRDDLVAVKNIKKWLPTGTEYFNHKPKKGIQFLQEHGVLKAELDPHEVCVFLRENPSLDKKMIGEYISGRSNSVIMQAFVKMFDFTDTRIDEALRLYLETFRLPGEAPLISMLMEHFAEHWHKCNGEPFANADAAFTLAYAVIMLNVDQHNHNVKRQNNPMTNEDFKKNLKKVNGGNDFDQDMLDEIYTAIKNDEIVMPAEQTGIVRENYLWKVLLRRGASKDGTYIHVASGAYDEDLFSLIWGPTVAALSFVFDKSEDPAVYKHALWGFNRCAFISSHFSMTANLDMLMATLGKYTTLNGQPKSAALTVQFGLNTKAQLALKSVFELAHQHGENIREGWKNLFDLILTLYTQSLLPKCYTEAEDFIDKSGRVVLVYENVQLQKQDTGLFSSLYSYMVSSENIPKNPNQEEQELIKRAKECITECGLEQIITDSKFLHEGSLLDLVKALIELSRGPDVEKSLGYSYNENVAVFFLELLVKVVLQNRDRVMTIWEMVRVHLYTLVMNASHCDYQFLLERSVIGLLRLAIRLMRNEEMSPVVLQSLRMLLMLKSTTLYRISRQISFGLYELLKTSAQNIHTSTDWSIIFTLLECVGAGAQPPKPIVNENQAEKGAKSDGDAPASSEEETPTAPDRGYQSDTDVNKSPVHAGRSQSPLIVPVSPIGSPQNNSGGWILVGNEGEIQPIVGRAPPAHQYSLSLDRPLGPHDPYGLVKCCESLAFLVRDVAHITPYNFDNCVHCIRTFVEASLHANKRRKHDSRLRHKNPRKSHRSPASSPDEDDSDEEALPGAYHQVTFQLLDLMHTLHTRTAQIFKWWAEEGGELAQEISLWTQGWCPLLQGIARLCCDPRKEVRMHAITYLQRALLVHDLQTLTGPEWAACFNRVLFPLLNQLLQPVTNVKDLAAMEETRMRAATVLSKVFLHHLTPLLSLETFSQLWLTILEYMDRYMNADKSDLLAEAIPESLKNMLLVMESAGVFQNSPTLWGSTWERINRFLPGMKEELFKEKEAKEGRDSSNAAPQQAELPAPVEVVPEFPRSTIQVSQHNIENATRSSIILQPPTSNSINSPLFAHLGQMVSTPIGPPTVVTDSISAPLAESQPLQQSPVHPQVLPPLPTLTQPQPQGAIAVNTPATTQAYHPTHTFPVLYAPSFPGVQSAVAVDIPHPPTGPHPPSLYTEFTNNPYNFPDNNTFRSSAQLDAHLPPSPNHNNNAFGECLHADLGAAVAMPEDADNDDTACKANGNVFRSANYFATDCDIPPGSEMLFAGAKYPANTNDIPQVAEQPAQPPPPLGAHFDI
ncbi:Golgi-specific brefeldin A-resistance guanine nucleotide exchange factor 1 isoform X2 [Atheta coriaria]|uniref:Golgi-specific brefeldin A-resistance guanine nucleotide exchange factor 1 isoform X2 n=1 Tax=Dalotia coriaria TaxID=877792 RepID=UPI0031F34E54